LLFGEITKKPSEKSIKEGIEKVDICEKIYADLCGPFPVETPDKKLKKMLC